MARIRTIKPETFTSDDVNALPVAARWTFVGLWCYVDDAGRGRADPRLVKAAVWPIDDAVTAIDICGYLDEMEKRCMICRYTIDGVDYLHVINFDQHQRINRASVSKIPPCSRSPHGGLTEPSLSPHGINGHESQQVKPLTEPSVNPHGAVTEGSHPRACAPEQGTGNREQGLPPTAGALTLAATDAQSLIGEWVEHCRKRPPGTVIGQVGKQIKAMLAEGIDPADVRTGLAAWWRKGLHPSALPAVVNEAMNAQPAAVRAASSAKPSTTDQRVAQAREVGRRLQARLDAEQTREITA